MADLIDTTEMYLKTILELEEDGVTPCVPHRGPLGPFGADGVADGRPYGA